MQKIEATNSWHHTVLSKLGVHTNYFSFRLPTTTDSDGLSDGAIAGIIIGATVAIVIVAILVVILLVCLWLRHKDRSGKFKPSYDTQGKREHS